MNSQDVRPLRVCMLDLAAILPYYTGHLCAALEAREHIAVVLASATYQYDPEFFRRQGTRNRFGLLNLAFKLKNAPEPVRQPLKLLEYLVNLAALLLRFMVLRPDVLHVQFLPLATRGLSIERWFLRAAKLLGITVVYTVHNVLPQDTGERYRRTYRDLYHLADWLVCHDARAASRLTAEFAVDPGRISVIPHGPLFENSNTSGNDARTRLGIHGDTPIVLWQGILRPYKGVAFLLRAWKRLSEIGADGVLVIAGTGDRDLVQEIEAETAALDIQSRVRLELRFLPIAEVADWYDAADILVYPYREITTSGALLTGIVRGKAVIASRLPAFEQILRDGDNALLVRYGDTDGLAYALVRLIEQPELRRSLANGLQSSQSSFPRWAEIAGRTCECYHDAMREHPTGAQEPQKL